MQFLKTYLRVLKLLGSEKRLATILALCNLALAAAQFAEPMLFGRIIDKLTAGQTEGRTLEWSELAPLIAHEGPAFYAGPLPWG